MINARLLQGYIDEQSKQSLNPELEPVDISFGVDHPLGGYGVHKTLLDKGIMEPAKSPVGIVSWQFEAKTLVPLREFALFCDGALNRKADVAFINPQIGAEALYINVWEQAVHSGRIGHEQVMRLQAALFTQKQLEQSALMTRASFALGDYFVGNHTFWKRHTMFCEEILQKAEALAKAAPDMAGFTPLVIERLFAMFLATHPEIGREDFKYSLERYERKFGADVGAYVYRLSQLKNDGVNRRQQPLLDQWQEVRAPVLKSPDAVWLKDDPRPAPQTKFHRDEGNPTVVWLDEFDAILKNLRSRAELNRLFLTISDLSWQLSVYKELNGYALFLPQFDAVLQQCAESLVTARGPAQANDVIVHVATEVYGTGGHTRVIEDMVRVLPGYRHVLILTDVMESYRTRRIVLGFLEDRFAELNLEVIFLKETGLPQKVSELASRIAGLAPKAVLMCVHHYDVVAGAAICGRSAPRVVYIHNCDHNPALGAMRGDYIHLDLSPCCHDACKMIPTLSAQFLGLSVEDKGVIQTPQRDGLTGVTCADSYKYNGKCGFSYGELVASLFAGGVTQLIHIGSMPVPHKERIRTEIRAMGQDPERLEFRSNVTNFSAALKDIAPDFYLCSYPIGGGKAMVEAMSVGLPILNPRAPETPPLICADMSLGVALTISSLEEVPQALRRLKMEKRELGARNRKVFDQNYSFAAFRKKLEDIVTG